MIVDIPTVKIMGKQKPDVITGEMEFEESGRKVIPMAVSLDDLVCFNEYVYKDGYTLAMWRSVGEVLVPWSKEDLESFLYQHLQKKLVLTFTDEHDTTKKEIEMLLSEKELEWFAFLHEKQLNSQELTIITE